MGHVIHARVLEDDNDIYVFRIWSTVVDAYLTVEMNEEELNMFLLKSAIDQAIDSSMGPQNQRRIDVAKEQGTSGFADANLSLRSPWKEEIEQ